MESFVVDASIGASWVHPGQASAETDALLAEVARGARLVVPAFWPIEMANLLLVLERRKKLSAHERRTALSALGGLSVTVDAEMPSLAFTELSSLAHELSLSVYDAAYLELAMRLRIPLACRDSALRNAARRRGVTLLP
jgi:predicted nucleic acid-binding protein